VAYTLELKGGLLGTGIGAPKKLTDAELATVAGLLHDRMTESGLRSAHDPAGLFPETGTEPPETVGLQGRGKGRAGPGLYGPR